MRKEVLMGEIAVAKKNTDILVASGVGSCVIITIYDTYKKVGALAHAMLPSGTDDKLAVNKRDTKRVDIAIGEMLSKLYSLGSQRRNLQAKIAGGANMYENTSLDMGKDNIISARDKLAKEGIALVGECVGGHQGRSIEFSVGTGIMTVKSMF